LPEFAKHAPLARAEIAELLIEHVKIRSLISQICEEHRGEQMSKLGELLRIHIHKEERIIEDG
jgi:hypothetical protein